MHCRFIDTGFNDAFTNMAIDEALLQQCQIPILRVYQWKPSSVSIGQNQDLIKEINIEKAKHLIACLGSDSDNILLILTVKELNPGIKISARANKESVIKKLKHAGASYVVVPSSIGGEELAKAAGRG